MNILNAYAFAAFGAAMEILPRAFSSWFPPTNADQASCHALWLDLMGAVQITVGVGFIVRMQIIPAAYRVLSLVPARDQGPLALPSPRGAHGR
jgi:hypothetical protein